MLKENEVLKVRPVVVERFDAPDAEAIEMVLQERRSDGVYQRSVAALGERDLARFQSNVRYMRRTRDWAEKIDL